ncbi:hypothetical protein AWX17_27760 [Priestia megaterium]|nr:hypothetical protein AWX17_27760 [Priestia megaterium]
MPSVTTGGAGCQRYVTGRGAPRRALAGFRGATETEPCPGSQTPDGARRRAPENTEQIVCSLMLVKKQNKQPK